MYGEKTDGQAYGNWCEIFYFNYEARRLIDWYPQQKNLQTNIHTHTHKKKVKDKDKIVIGFYNDQNEWKSFAVDNKNDKRWFLKFVHETNEQ